MPPSPDLTTTFLRVPNRYDPKAIYVPLPGQRQFHTSKARFRAWLGGKGNGKSVAACIETIKSALLFPGSVNAVLRWDQTSLRTTTWRTLQNILYASDLRPFIRRDINSATESVLEFANGSLIQGAHAKSWEKFGSLELSSFFMDECTEVGDGEVYDELVARCGRHAIGPDRGWLTGLPNHHDWVWEKFIRDRLPDHEWFTGTSWDNPFLREGYADELKAQYGPEKALIMLMGSFDIVQGRLLEMFDRETHLIPRKQFPPSWPRYASIDPGFNPDPCAMVRAVCDPEGNLILEGEYERCGRVTEEWSRDILSLNQACAPIWYVIDPSADRQTHAAAVSVMETARKCGVSPIRAGSNDIGQSVQRLRSLLTKDPQHEYPSWHRKSGQKGAPHLFVCEDLALTISELANFRQKNCGAATLLQGIKLPDHGHDLVDSIRYLCLEHMNPAPTNAAPPLNDFWRELLTPPHEERPYLEQISRARVNSTQTAPARASAAYHPLPEKR